jgi:DNA-binding NarL/FixJ family response regulator
MEQPKVRILLADDHPLVLLALRTLLAKEADFEVIAEVSDGEEAVKVASQMIPDITIMDISMPKLNGIEATKQIKEKCPDIAVLVLTVHDDIEHSLAILEAGADGYLTKSMFVEGIVQAIRIITSGATIIPPKVFRQVIKSALRYPGKSLPNITGETLSSREIEVLGLLARGMSNKEIACQLGLSDRTIKGILVVLFSKLQVNSRTEAVICALRLGIINLEG